jgi:alanine dehydrogenase
VSARTTLGVVRTSRKPDEHRLPIHPAHVARIDPALRERILLEEGYGERFGVTDEELAPLVAGLLPRDRLLAESDIVLLPKPQASDLAAMHPGQVLWGWPHCVQDPELTQLAIDRRLTVIAWEAMNHWTRDGHFSVHVFHKNNELAGYCSVLHALSLIGVSGDYGRRLDAAVISFGATARGAVRALSAFGIHEVAGLTQRETAAVASPMASVDLLQFEADEDDPSRLVVQVPDGPTPMPAYLARHDLVVNCVFQDTEAPLTFVTEDDLPAFARGSLIVDVSCDEGMGFSWAHPTSFAAPLREVGHGVHYYAVDHSPSWLWNSATWEISDALAPYLPIVMGGEEAWDADVTVRRAIEIRDGVVVNPRILSFQGRAAEYPHPRA